MIHANTKIFGKVQMVFFRVSAKEKAQELGLYGFIRNESDGELYIEVEGNKKKVKEFLRWCKKGPQQAKVEKMQTKKGDLKNFNSFDILF